MAENETPLRRSITWSRIIRPGDHVDVEAEDAAYWLQFSPEERFLLVWQLSEELWKWVQVKEPRESGLSRSVARVHRV